MKIKCPTIDSYQKFYNLLLTIYCFLIESVIFIPVKTNSKGNGDSLLSWNIINFSVLLLNLEYLFIVVIYDKSWSNFYANKHKYV